MRNMHYPLVDARQRWNDREARRRTESHRGAALVISNHHHHLPRPGEDVQTLERDLPGRNTAGFNTMEIGALPLETAQTMNNSWGFRLSDRIQPEFVDTLRVVGRWMERYGKMTDSEIHAVWLFLRSVSPKEFGNR